MINYTFIIPHHNAPQLLNRCLESIPKREDVQVIVVDDNSEENLRPVVAWTDVEVIYIDKQYTRGAGHARNEGIKRAKGKWLLFVDCDDFLEENVLSVLDKHSASQSDIIFFKIAAVNSDTLLPSNRCLAFNAYIDAHQQHKPMSEGTLRYIQCVPWGKMIRRSLVADNHILFEEIRYGNDVIFSLRCGILAKSIASTDDILYVVTDREGSLVTQVSYESMLCRYKVSVRRAKTLVENGKYLYLGCVTPNTRAINSSLGTSKISEFYSYAAENGFTKTTMLAYSVIGRIGSMLRYLFRKI